MFSLEGSCFEIVGREEAGDRAWARRHSIPEPNLAPVAHEYEGVATRVFSNKVGVLGDFAAEPSLSECVGHSLWPCLTVLPTPGIAPPVWLLRAWPEGSRTQVELAPRELRKLDQDREPCPSGPLRA